MINKVFKGALQYNYYTTLKERINDTKNVLLLDENTMVYARKFNASSISLRGKNGCFLETRNGLIYKKNESTPYNDRTIYTDFNINWNFDKNFHLMTLKEVNHQILEYENLISNLKRLGYSVRKKDVTYVFYEIIINEESIRG